MPAKKGKRKSLPPKSASVPDDPEPGASDVPAPSLAPTTADKSIPFRIKGAATPAIALASGPGPSDALLSPDSAVSAAQNLVSAVSAAVAPVHPNSQDVAEAAAFPSDVAPFDPSQTSIGKFQSAFRTSFERLLNDLLERRKRQVEVGQEVIPLRKDEMDALVDQAWSRLPGTSAEEESSMKSWYKEARLRVVDEGLKSMVMELARTMHSTPSTSQNPKTSLPFQLLFDALDVSLTLSEKGYLEAGTPLSLFELLIDVETIEGAEKIFTYLDSRVERLTVDMQPSRGKGLVLLRTCNDLLRRLSKTSHTIFCGKILMFLANVFPLSEKSGVNLRGAFNTENITLWERQQLEGIQSASIEAEDKAENEAKDEPKPDGMDVDEEPAKKPDILKLSVAQDQEESDFYAIFWDLQRFFSNPPSLFVQNSANSSKTTSRSGSPAIPVKRAPTPTGPAALLKQHQAASANASGTTSETAVAATANLTTLRQGVLTTLEVFAKASKKQRELLGSATPGKGRSKGKQPERSSVLSSSQEDIKRDFFFPKFLTSRNLLDLEIADSTFRQQVLVQFLILFQFLLIHTPGERAKAAALPHPNRIASSSFELGDADEKWIRELRARTLQELRDAAPEGADRLIKTVQLILDREQNWITWKANTAPNFEKTPLAIEQVQKVDAQRATIVKPPRPIPHRLGNPTLTQLWENNITRESLEEYNAQSKTPDLKYYHNLIKRQDMLLARNQPSSVDGTPRARDAQALAIEERKASLSWRALRIASNSHLHLFSKIDTGDVSKLMQEIENGAQAVPKPGTAVAREVERAESPSILSTKQDTAPTDDASVLAADVQLTAVVEAVVNGGNSVVVEESEKAGGDIGVAADGRGAKREREDEADLETGDAKKIRAE